MKVLLVEDDMALAMGILYSLKNEGYEVEHAATVAQAEKWLEACKAEEETSRKEPKMALFDVMLPDGNGYQLLTYCRDLGLQMPVIFLTAVSDEVNVVQGLDMGADDYITKPFRVKELMSRIRAVGRRYEAAKERKTEHRETEQSQNLETENPASERLGLSRLDNTFLQQVLTYRDIRVDINRAAVWKEEPETALAGEKKRIELTPVEYKLLIFFISNQGRVLERNQLLERIFDSAGNFIDDNTLSVYVKRLRDKLGDTDRERPYIRTVRGIGYIMEKEHVY
jgi:DNA-binding response OmpR family regulator